MSTERLHLKQIFKIENRERINNFKCYMKDGGLQIFVTNGDAANAAIRLDCGQMDLLRLFLEEKLR